MLVEWKTAVRFTNGIRVTCKSKFSTMLSADDQAMLPLERSQIVEEKLNVTKSFINETMSTWVCDKEKDKNYYGITLQKKSVRIEIFVICCHRSGK